jgi:deoxyribonuclease V
VRSSASSRTRAEGRPKPGVEHRFDVGVAEARAIQERLRCEVVERDALPSRVRFVAGADVSYDRKSPLLFAAVVVLDPSRLEIVEVASTSGRATFPYVPGYLSFRELPPLLEAFAKLRTRPDLVVCDGHGRAHPRRFGFACHLGVALDLPSIGFAKSRLVGEHAEPGRRRGAHVALRDGGEVIGEVVRTREGVAPVYVSIGHRVSLATARRWVLRLAPRFRVPEPVRAAHAEANRLRREGSLRGWNAPAARRPRCPLSRASRLAEASAHGTHEPRRPESEPGYASCAGFGTPGSFSADPTAMLSTRVPRGPMPGEARMTIRLRPATRRKVERFAAREGISLNEAIDRLLLSALDAGTRGPRRRRYRLEPLRLGFGFDIANARRLAAEVAGECALRSLEARRWRSPTSRP